MSSLGEDGGGRPAESKKKRKLHRACDVCKRKKIGCDGASMPDKRCSNCIAGSFECTYTAAAKRAGAPSRAYVEGLENRLRKMEKLLQRFVPDADLVREVTNTTERGGWMLDMPPATAGSSSFNKISHGGSPDLPPTGKSEFASQYGDDINIASENMKHLRIDNSNGRFFGSSSSYMFLQTALDLKGEYAGKEKAEHQELAKQAHLWATHPWEHRTMKQPEFSYRFPEDDLQLALIDLFFEKYNPYIPLLHRPTFERSIKQGLHLSHRMFGAVVLLVYAIASRFSNDPRVFLDGLEGKERLLSSGWEWFDQVQMINKSLLDPPSLYELQFYCLSVMFLQGTSVPHACWTLVGVGIRLAQEVGAHRRKALGDRPSVESELWKRAFWLLICIDTSMSSGVGRPCCTNDEDFDVDLPLLCDDEYWEHPDPEQAFQQPPGKAPIVACFNTYISLNVILGRTLRNIYSIGKSKFLGQEQKIVAELDSALNQWMDSIPEHLRWDPNRENNMFFNQSALLYANYYYVQIMIHRPFISSCRKPSVLSFPSLAICTNAARSCCHVMDTQRRHEPLALPHVQSAVFTSGVVLLLHVWGGQKVGLTSNKSKGMEDVDKCIQVLRDQEKRWHSGGRFCNLLYGLASAGNLTFPNDPPRNKRGRDPDSPTTATTPLSDHSFPYTPEGSHGVAGPWRVASSKAASPVPTTAPDVPLSAFTLPMNSRELGRLPLYAQSDFVNYIQPFSTDNNMWDPTPLDSCLPLFYASLAGPSMDGIAPEGLPANFSMNELYYNQMASVFSGWKGPVPELPYEQPTIPAPYQYHTSQSVPLPDEHIPSPSDASVRNVPVQWEPLPVVSHNWKSTYSSLKGGNDTLQGDGH